MPLNPLGYPFDPTGAALTNFITDEVHVFNNASERVFVPEAGPFYTDGLTLRNSVTNAILMPSVDYKALHLHVEAVQATGKTVCSVIYVHNPAVPGVTIDYHVPGGIYSDTADVIRTFLQSYTLPNVVYWGQILGAPVQFPPAEHLHHLDEVYGWKDVVAVLSDIYGAILAGDGMAFSAIYQYFWTALQNENYVTQQQLLDLSLTGIITVKPFNNINALRAETDRANASMIYAVLGATSIPDQQGRLFVWKATETASDNGDTVIKPDDVGIGDPGRFITMLKVEQDLKSLQDSYNALLLVLQANGISADLQVTNRLAPGTDLDDVTATGKYYFLVSDGITSVPSDLTHGILTVDRRNALNVCQRIQSSEKDASVYVRTRRDSSVFADWGNWKRLATTSEIPGPRVLTTIRPNATPYVTHHGTSSNSVVHDMEGNMISFGYEPLGASYMPEYMDDVPSYEVAGITFNTANHNGHRLRFVGVVQMANYIGQGDGIFWGTAFNLKIYDSIDTLLFTIPLTIIDFTGGYTNNGVIGHVTFNVVADWKLYDFGSSVFPSGLKAALNVHVESSSQGGSADLQIASVENFMIHCQY